MMTLAKTINQAPPELADSIAEFWRPEEWDNAASVSWLESGWDAFALNDTTSPDFPCGSILNIVNGVKITAERSVGYFQINACNIPPNWTWYHLFNARHNAGTAHKLWVVAGNSWSPWFFSAKRLGLI